MTYASVYSQSSTNSLVLGFLCLLGFLKNITAPKAIKTTRITLHKGIGEVIMVATETFLDKHTPNVSFPKSKNNCSFLIKGKPKSQVFSLVLYKLNTIKNNNCFFSIS